jgi:hypothetical protein
VIFLENIENETDYKTFDGNLVCGINRRENFHRRGIINAFSQGISTTKYVPYGCGVGGQRS